MSMSTGGANGEDWKRHGHFTNIKDLKMSDSTQQNEMMGRTPCNPHQSSDSYDSDRDDA